MPVYHVHASFIKAGQGSAADFSRYIAREGRDQASQMQRYIDRELDGSGKDDLIASGSANLPGWAHESAALFFGEPWLVLSRSGCVPGPYRAAAAGGNN